MAKKVKQQRGAQGVDVFGQMRSSPAGQVGGLIGGATPLGAAAIIGGGVAELANTGGGNLLTPDAQARIAAGEGVRPPASATANVLGMSAFAPPGGGVSGGGGGGGFVGGGTSMVDQRTQLATDLANQNFQSAINALDRREEVVRGEADRARGMIGQQLEGSQEDIRQTIGRSQREARQNRSDALLRQRRVARAVGATGSGFFELSNELDQQFNQLQSDLRIAGLSEQNRVQLVADQALADIENSLVKTVAEIENDRDAARTAKDQAIAEAQIVAQDMKMDIARWSAGRGGGRGGGSSAGAGFEQLISANLASYFNDVAANPGQAEGLLSQFQQGLLAQGAPADTVQDFTQAARGLVNPGLTRSDEFYLRERNDLIQSLISSGRTPDEAALQADALLGG